MGTAAVALLLAGLAADGMSNARRSYELQRAGDLAGAEQQMREALRLEPGNPLFHSALSGILVATGRSLDAITELQAALDCHPVAPALTQLQERLERMSLNEAAQFATAGKFRDGLALAQGAATRLPHSSSILQMLGYFQAKLRLHRDAVGSYSRALALAPQSADAAIGLAIAQADAGFAPGAVQSLETGMRTFPKDPRFPQALGNLLLAEADVSQNTRAVALFGKALALEPELFESHYQLGNLALRNQDYPAALQHLEAAARLAADDGRVHFALARLYRAQRKDADAARQMALFRQTQSVPRQ